MNIYLRPLRKEDALVSWKWRNDPEIWALTGRTWNNIVTKEIEENWIEQVSLESNSVRMAICIMEADKYIGNVQLTNMNNKEATFHIFIGDKDYWGKGVGYLATQQMLEHAKKTLNLNYINLSVKKQNLAAIHIYKKSGFEVIGEEDDDYIMRYSIMKIQ